MRNMPDRKTIPSQRWLGLASFATRYMPNGTRISHFWRYDGAKMAFSLSISRKIPTQLFNQKNWTNGTRRNSLGLLHHLAPVEDIHAVGGRCGEPLALQVVELATAGCVDGCVVDGLVAAAVHLLWVKKDCACNSVKVASAMAVRITFMFMCVLCVFGSVLDELE